MTNPLGTTDFFALEAGDCLNRLEQLVSGTATPSADEFLRMARVLRGSALMAAQTPIARAAAGLEGFARARRASSQPWDAATREQLAQAVEEFRLLVRRVREWNQADTDRASRLGRDLERLTGATPGQGAAPSSKPKELTAAVRAFVAREGALIASSLDSAARALRASPGDREPLYNVIRRMQSLRGLAELGELAPLADILDGIELAVGDLTRLFAPPPGVDDVINAAAQALTQISREVAEQGRPDPNGEEARHFTELLLRAFAVERDVVPIESLYYADDPEPLTHPAAQPQFAATEPPGPLELVSQGEHLCQSADLIEGAGSPIQRDLRLYNLLGTLRSAGISGSDPVAGALGIFARSAREALATGVATHSLPDLVTQLRDAGRLLRSMVDTDDRMLVSRRLLDVAHQLDELRTTAESGPVVPIESLSYDGEKDVVPIESLAPDEEVLPIESLTLKTEPMTAPNATPSQPTGLEASFRTLSRLVRDRVPLTPAFSALLSGSVGRTTNSGTLAEETPVPIATLCYRGQAALRRADAVRQEIAIQLTRDATLESLQPLLQELLDLVPLALAEP
jgi:chemotaxis protein histidine kinase CheA